VLDRVKLAFGDNARTLYWIDLATGAVKRAAAEPVYSPIDTLRTSWSPDSRWLAYTLTTKVGFQTISLYFLEQDRSVPLTDGPAEAGEPVFDAGGKYLFFLASTDAGPVKNRFDQSFTDMPQIAERIDSIVIGNRGHVDRPAQIIRAVSLPKGWIVVLREVSAVTTAHVIP